MPLSYRNIIDTNQLSDALTTGDYSKTIKKKNSNIAKYIKGYANETAIEALINSDKTNSKLDLETIRRTFGLENRKLDNYDPYNTTNSKKEEFWFYTESTEKMDGKQVQELYDEDTNTFKRGLYSQFDFRTGDFWYEDPFLPSFELFFDNTSAFFNSNNANYGLQSFINKYIDLGTPYSNRLLLWNEFNKVFWKIFEKSLAYDSSSRNIQNKAYYITKIAGLNNLNKKIINYKEDKITITLNEDIAMFAWYLSELYNNIAYSYKDQRYMFPENVLRFNMMIKINDLRTFQMPQNNSIAGEKTPVDGNNLNVTQIKNVISPKSQILYQLNDCNFNFFESKNYGDEIEIGGYNVASNYSPQSLTFDIYFKSVTRYSNFPLLENSPKINGWENSIFTNNYSGSTAEGTLHNLNDNIDRIKTEGSTAPKSYLNQLKAKGAQTIVNSAANYMDNLETKLREVRGSAVNNLLQQFRNATINKIEPDNVYNPDFNNRISLKNLGKGVASGLLNELENSVKNAANF